MYFLKVIHKSLLVREKIVILTLHSVTNVQGGCFTCDPWLIYGRPPIPEARPARDVDGNLSFRWWGVLRLRCWSQSRIPWFPINSWLVIMHWFHLPKKLLKKREKERVAWNEKHSAIAWAYCLGSIMPESSGPLRHRPKWPIDTCRGTYMYRTEIDSRHIRFKAIEWSSPTVGSVESVWIPNHRVRN